MYPLILIFKMLNLPANNFSEETPPNFSNKTFDYFSNNVGGCQRGKISVTEGLI